MQLSVPGALERWELEAAPTPRWPLAGPAPLVRISDGRALLAGAPLGRLEMAPETEAAFDALCRRERGAPDKRLLHAWCPRVTEHGLRLDGWTWQRRKKSFMSSAAISRWISEREVQDVDGQVFVLDGNLNTQLAEAYGLPALAQSAFQAGVPRRWRQMVQELQDLDAWRSSEQPGPASAPLGEPSAARRPGRPAAAAARGQSRGRKTGKGRGGRAAEPAAMSIPKEGARGDRSSEVAVGSFGSFGGLASGRRSPVTVSLTDVAAGGGPRATLYDRTKDESRRRNSARRRSLRVLLQRLPEEMVSAQLSDAGRRRRQAGPGPKHVSPSAGSSEPAPKQRRPAAAAGAAERGRSAKSGPRGRKPKPRTEQALPDSDRKPKAKGEGAPAGRPGTQRHRLQQMALLSAQNVASDDLFAAAQLGAAPAAGLLDLGGGQVNAAVTPTAPGRGRGRRLLHTHTPLAALASVDVSGAKTPTSTLISPGNPLNSVHREEGVRYMVNRKKTARPARHRLHLAAPADPAADSATGSVTSSSVDQMAQVIGADAAWLLSDDDPLIEGEDHYFDFEML